jgi:hypothetical protein
VTDKNTEAKIEKLISEENLRPGKWYDVTARAIVRKNAAGKVEYNTARVSIKQLEGEPGAPGTEPPVDPDAPEPTPQG